MSSLVRIRDLHTISELERVLELEKQVWGLADCDATPVTLAIALQAAGSLWLGAFDGEKLIGFAFAFPSLDKSGASFHSHMLAVDPAYRGHGVGYRLKLAERERALARNIKEMTWTFDPLRSGNAHLNFSRLGVISDCYKIDFYGPQTSSPLHTNGTDRLWVTWHMASDRVEQRLKGRDTRVEILDALRHLQPLVRSEGQGRPVLGDLDEALSQRQIAVEIPAEIAHIEREDRDLARHWRLVTRQAFTAALEAGFIVQEFCRSVRGEQGAGAYLLDRAID